MFIRYHMTVDPITIPADLSVAEADAILQRYHIRHLPVVDEQGVLQGILSDRDVRSARASSVAVTKERENVLEKIRQTPVSAVMTHDPLFLTPNATLDDALWLFQGRRIGAFPVIDLDERVVGIFSTADLMNAYRELFGLGAKGSALVAIKDNGDPQMLSKLVRILEDQQVPFTRLLRAEGTDERGPRVYVRINTYNIRPIHRAIREAGFTIHVPEKIG
ncbi:MAG: CBS domain-containing protein [Desulfobulbus sp.]|jgi:acetoin utilization protein AcuB